MERVEDFVDECMPGLRGAEVVDVAEASGVDICSYDLVADDDFIIGPVPGVDNVFTGVGWRGSGYKFAPWVGRVRSEEHTSELQSHLNLVCRLLLEKKKK